MGSMLINKCWDIIYHRYKYRNTVLHETKAVNKNSGATQLTLSLDTLSSMTDDHIVGNCQV